MARASILAIVVALVELALFYAVRGPEGAVRLGLFLVLPLACVLYPAEMGGAAGATMFHGQPNRTTPAGCVLSFGWALLLVPCLWLLAIGGGGGVRVR